MCQPMVIIVRARLKPCQHIQKSFGRNDYNNSFIHCSEPVEVESKQVLTDGPIEPQTPTAHAVKDTVETKGS